MTWTVYPARHWSDCELRNRSDVDKPTRSRPNFPSSAEPPSPAEPFAEPLSVAELLAAFGVGAIVMSLGSPHIARHAPMQFSGGTLSPGSSNMPRTRWTRAWVSSVGGAWVSFSPQFFLHDRTDHRFRTSTFFSVVFLANNADDLEEGTRAVAVSVFWVCPRHHAVRV